MGGSVIEQRNHGPDSLANSGQGALQCQLIERDRELGVVGRRVRHSSDPGGLAASENHAELGACDQLGMLGISRRAVGGWDVHLDELMLGSLHGNQAATDDFASVIAGALSPVDFFSAAAVPGCDVWQSAAESS